MLQATILLDCTHMLLIPTESVLTLPKVGDKIVCANCKREREILRVGTPSRVEHYIPPPDEKQERIP